MGRPLANGVLLLGTYHPSLHNTNTGVLEEAMFSKVFMQTR